MITVAICTHNRHLSLQRTLTSLAEQQGVAHSAFEVLVVDNNCTDATPDIVESMQDRIPVRRVEEKSQGLSHARNRAVAEFRGDVLIFTDDDIRFSPRWLSAYIAGIMQFGDAEYFGGRMLPDWSGRRPNWMGDDCLHLIDGIVGWFDHGTQTRPFVSGEPTPYGASFGATRTLLDRIGGFRIDLGTGGTGIGRGEETEFLLRARRAGAMGVYVGEALCFHAVNPNSLTLRALYRYGQVCGRSQNAIADTRSMGSLPAAASYLMRGCYQLARGRGDRFRQCVINAGIQMGTRYQRPRQRRLSTREPFTGSANNQPAFGEVPHSSDRA